MGTIFTPPCFMREAVTRRSIRRLSRIAKGFLTRCSKQAHARIAKGGGLMDRVRQVHWPAVLLRPDHRTSSHLNVPFAAGGSLTFKSHAQILANSSSRQAQVLAKTKFSRKTKTKARRTILRRAQPFVLRRLGRSIYQRSSPTPTLTPGARKRTPARGPSSQSR
jgi:hypothetical protein